MEKIGVRSTLKKYADTISKHSEHVTPGFDAERIHKLRTGVKKLRAILSLQNNEKASRLPPSFKETYKAAGGLRDMQVQLVHLNKHQIGTALPGFALWLRTCVRHAEEHWVKTYHKAAITRLQRHVETAELHKISTEELDHYFNSALAEIESMICSAHTDEVLHEIRKKVKSLMYIAQWCKKNWSEGWKVLQSYPIDLLKALSEKAGNYNDERIGLGSLTTYLKEETDADALKAGQHMEQQWMRRKNRKRKQLITAILHLTGQKKAIVLP